MTQKNGALAVRTAEESLAHIEHRLQKAGMYPDRVEAASAVGAPEAEDAVLDLLLSEGHADPHKAFDQLFSIFGIGRYANREKLAAEGTSFIIRRIVQRVHGGFERKDADGKMFKPDDWALEIVTEDGEAQILTFERNPSRDKFLLMLSVGVKKHGETYPLTLFRIDKKDKTHFYGITPAHLNAAEKMKVVNQVVREVQTIEGEATVAA